MKTCTNRFFQITSLIATSSLAVASVPWASSPLPAPRSPLPAPRSPIVSSLNGGNSLTGRSGGSVFGKSGLARSVNFKAWPRTDPVLMKSIRHIPRKQSGQTFAITTPLPGAPWKWEPYFKIYGGDVNLSSGNVQLIHMITQWSSLGAGINFALFFNSQSQVNGTLGPKWSMSYDDSIAGTTPAVITDFNGRKESFALVNGSYVSPAGLDESLTANQDGTWTRAWKSGISETFNTSGQAVAVTDANGNQTNIGRNNLGQIQSVTDSVGQVLSLTYSNGRLTTISAPESKVWTLAYDSAGRLATVSDPALSGTVFSSSFTYTSGNDVATLTNRLGSKFTYTYGTNDSFGTVTDPQGNVAGLSADIPSQLDVNGFSSKSNATTSSPDTLPQSYPTNTTSVVYTQDAGGVASEYGVDSLGETTAMRDGTGAQWNYTYSPNHDLTATVYPDGTKWLATFNSTDDKVQSTDPLGNVTNFSYDSASNLLSQTDPLGHVKSYTYDSHHNILTIKDENGKVRNYAYNSVGEETSATDPLGGVSNYGYDALGNVASMTDQLGHSTTFVYDMDRVTSRTDPLGRTTTYSYDAWNRKIAINYPQSVSQTIAFDAESDITKTIDGTGTRTYSYDALQHRIATTDPMGPTTASYDPAGRLLTQTDTTTRKLSYAYDNAGRNTSITDQYGTAQTTSYDGNGRLNSISTSTGYTINFSMDPDGRKVSQTTTQGKTQILSAALTYDSASRVTNVNDSTSVTAYTYDPAGQILTETRTGASPYADTYTYDANGNRATDSRSNNGVPFSNGTYSYDAANELVSVTDPIKGNQAYTWNADNTMATMTDNNPFLKSFLYDEEGRLIEIDHVQNGIKSAAYQYGYGWDGARRWRKNYSDNSWLWYPCGAACSAGQLVIMRNTIGGSTWSTDQYNVGNLIQGNQTMLPSGSGKSITRMGPSGVIGTDVRDSFDLLRSGTDNQYGDAVLADDGFLIASGYSFAPQQVIRNDAPVDEALCLAELNRCKDQANTRLGECRISCAGGLTVCLAACAKLCSMSWAGGPWGVAACLACIAACGVAEAFCQHYCTVVAATAINHCYDQYRICHSRVLKHSVGPPK